MKKILKIAAIATAIGAVTTGIVSNANARIVKHQPTLSENICLTFVKGSATFNNRAKARFAARRDWQKRVASKYSGRFASPQKSIGRIEKERYDKIEQNWRAIFIAKPCGPRSILTK